MICRIRCLLVCVLLMLLTACATVIDGSTQKIVINSLPSGAEVYQGKKFLGVTPLKLSLSGNDANSFWLKKTGYNNQVFLITQKVNRKKHLNLVALPVYGVTSTIDDFSGAGYKFQENNIVVELEKKDDASNKVRKCVGCKLLG